MRSGRKGGIGIRFISFVFCLRNKGRGRFCSEFVIFALRPFFCGLRCCFSRFSGSDDTGDGKAVSRCRRPFCRSGIPQRGGAGGVVAAKFRSVVRYGGRSAFLLYQDIVKQRITPPRKRCRFQGRVMRLKSVWNPVMPGSGRGSCRADFAAGPSSVGRG